MKKMLLIIFCGIISITFVACSNISSNDNSLQNKATQPIMTESNTANKNIVVYKNGEDKTYYEIKNGKTIKDINEYISQYNNWKVITSDEQISAEPDFYIDFQNGIALSLICDINSMRIGEKIEKNDKEYTLINQVSKENYYIPNEVITLLLESINTP